MAKSVEEIKATIKRIENDMIRAEATKEQIMTTLKKDFGVDSVEEASALLTKMQSEIVGLETEIKIKTEELQTLTDWGSL